MNDKGLVSAIDPTGTGKLPVREGGLLAQEDAENGRLGITGVVEDESRLRRRGEHRFRNPGSGTGSPAANRAEQGAPEGFGASSVLAMVKAFRILETNLRTVRLQDAATPQ